MRRLAPLFLLLAACTAPAVVDDAGTDAGAIPDSGPPPPPPPSAPAPEPLIGNVDVFLGTGGSGYNDIGSTFPGPQRPFGMIRPGPDTGQEGGAPGFTHCSGYAASDDFITGFSHTRMHGTGTSDYGHVALMPVPAMEDGFLGRNAYMSRFSEETGGPGYYAATLERGSIRAELTATERVAMHRYTFDGGSQAVIVDVGHRMSDQTEVVAGDVEVDAAAREVRGMARITGGYSGRFGGVPIHFVARFDRDFASFGTYADGARTEGATTASGPTSGAWVDFDPSGGAVVHVEVGISFVDAAGALANLDAESAAFDFEAMRAETESIWESWLSRVRIEARHDHDFVRFYSALYHTLLMPTLATDVDGRYRGIDAEVHGAAGFLYYTDFSLWDTYRTLHPWLTLVYPEIQLAFLRSLAQMAADGGAMPRWPLGIGYTGGMLGDPVALVMADSLVKGLSDFDLAGSYDALRRSAFGVAAPTFGGRGNAELYDTLGYVPIESGGWSTSETMEFAYADWAMAILARELGESADVPLFAARAGNWRNAWDPDREFFVGRHEDGRFVESFREERWQDFYSEGNARQYLWLVPHDLPGLAEQLGGRDVMLERLRTFFEESRRERRTFAPPEWYWHGNEPDIHAAFVFTAMGEPEEGGRWSRWVARDWYGDGPTGLPGNDDAGTLSAWLTFATIGVFPITGEEHYLLGSPLSTRTELAIGDGVFVIEAPDASDQAAALSAAALDGSPLENFRLSHAEIAPGSTLRLDMVP